MDDIIAIVALVLLLLLLFGFFGEVVGVIYFEVVD